MALFDFLKRKKEIEKASAKASADKKRPEKKSGKVLVAKTEDKKKVETVAKSTSLKAKNAKFSYEAIKQPHISEKASYLAEKDQYVFEVLPGYNKNEIKNAVEGIYKVDVLSVNMIKIPSKKRRLGRTEGFRKAYKKAVVKIKNGQKIEIL
jgi:large subunit ribosomal protein L23